MADSQEEDKTPKSEEDFMDPLGANDPLNCCLEDGFNDLDFDQPDIIEAPSEGHGEEVSKSVNDERIQPIKSCELDAMLAENRQQMKKMTLDDDDLDSETKDLFVVVDNPEKHTTTMESYMTFRVTSKTTRSEYDGQEFEVRRRYNDFLWLRQRLEETQTTHLVAPLPEKHSLRRLERFSPEFVKTRQLALQKFLSRIADHPVISYNKHFQTFLTAKQWEFQAAKKEGSGFMSRVADSFHSMSAAYMMKNRPPEFSVMSEYINTFSEKLGVLDRISQRILKEEYEYLAELNEWGPVFTLWSNSEDKLSLALRAMAKAVETNFLSLQDLIDSTETQLSHPLREYMLYADCVKNVLRRRDAIQMEYEMTHEELHKKKDEREQAEDANDSLKVSTSEGSYSLGSLLGRSPDLIKQQKEEKLLHQVEELTKQVEVLNDKMVCANADLKADMERWHKNKRRDFRKLFTEVADRQIEYYQKSLRAWEETIPLIQRTDQLPTDHPVTESPPPPPGEHQASPTPPDHTVTDTAATNPGAHS